jgi:hypothetical protein
VIGVVGCREKVSFGTVVNSSKPVKLVFRFKSILYRLFFCNNYSLLFKHGIYFVADIDIRVICFIFQLVDPNDFNVIACYVNIKVQLNLIFKQFCGNDYADLMIFIKKVLRQHQEYKSFSSTS